MNVEYKLEPGQSEAMQQKLLRWLDARFPYFFYSPNNKSQYPGGGFTARFLAAEVSGGRELLQDTERPRERVALLSYDYKNKIEALYSANPAVVDCPDVTVWDAELHVDCRDDSFVFFHPWASVLLEEFLSFEFPETKANPIVEVRPLESQESYVEKVRKIQQHIEDGDIYELNFCQGFAFESMNWDPLQGFLDLMEISPMPFSGLFKAGPLYLLAASPERFLKKTGNKIIAQPIKGTSKRGRSVEEDEQLRRQLFESEKERAENLMIVDLMRNDLAKVSQVGSVEVEELFGVYPFAKVHQMISTVSSRLKHNVSIQEIFNATFPMGSMTGAPKIKCMELIEHYENFRRGWFSGTMGVMEPGGDFDFNVVIRSIVFDKANGRGYFAVGSAITYDADPDCEFAECLLKAAAILEVLQGKNEQ